MSMTPGTRLGPYEIIGTLGAGGMGEVYRGHDTKLQRDIAIKVLPDLFAADADPSTGSGSPRASSRGDRVARFEREAQTLAALNHPNIAAIYGLENLPSGGCALIMELVDGEDLAQRVARGPLQIDDARAVARQIAEALEAAHERGIVHRDLKPANVRLTPDGTAKVLDFGLAKAIAGSDSGEFAISNSPTFTSPAGLRPGVGGIGTGLGVILGTAAYMAPEQARGKTVDRRADIWAFGCVLYEMLTASAPFLGETVTDTLSAIVSKDPDWTALPPATPQSVRRLLSRCLEKDPRKRLQAIGEARIALDDGSAAPEPAIAPRKRGISPLAAAALVAASIAAGALGVWLVTRAARAVPAPPLHLSLSLASSEGLDGTFALSPDGRSLAFVGIAGARRQIFLRRLDREQAEPLKGTEGNSGLAPAFSPDGRWLVFMAGGRLKKIPLDGGPPTELPAQAVLGSRIAWGSDGSIVFSNAALGLSRIPPAGGGPQTLTTVDASASQLAHEFPWFLPDGRTLLFTIRSAGAGSASGVATIVALTLATGEQRELFPGMVFGAVGNDRLIILRDDAILAVPFDFTRLAATGEAMPFLSQRPSFQRLVFANMPLFAVAPNGTAVVSPRGLQEDDAPLLMVDPAGKTSRLAMPAHRYSDPRLSPDGNRIAVHVFEESRDNWIADLRRGTFMRLTFDPGEDETPCWSPDGRWVYWTATRANRARVIYRKAADGTGPEQEIWKGNTHVHLGGVTPDGTTVIMSTVAGSTTQIIAVNVADGKERPLVTAPFVHDEPAISPDGKWLAYASNESGRKEVYVQPYPSLQGRAQISAAGGAQPVWARKGSRLFYRGSGKIMAVDITMKDGIQASAPNSIMDDTYESTQAAAHTAYDVAPDGRFLMVGKRSVAQASVNHLQIIYAGR